MSKKFFNSFDFYFLLILIISIIIGVFYFESIPKWLLKIFIFIWGSTFVGAIAFIIKKVFSKKEKVPTKGSNEEFKKLIEKSKSTVEFTIDTTNDIYKEIKFNNENKHTGTLSENKDFLYYKDLKNIIWKIPVNEKSINFDFNTNTELSDINDLFN